MSKNDKMDYQPPDANYELAEPAPISREQHVAGIRADIASKHLDGYVQNHLRDKLASKEKVA